mgnify:CR=1 FL=1
MKEEEEDENAASDAPPATQLEVEEPVPEPWVPTLQVAGVAAFVRAASVLLSPAR